MTVSLLSRERDGTDPHWIGQLGTYGNVQYAATTPGGSTTLSFDLGQRQGFQRRALRPGRLLDAYAGTAHVWSGIIDQPQRGAPWTVSAAGNVKQVKDYIASAGVASTTTSPIYNLTTIITNARSRGLTLTTAGTLSTVVGTGSEGAVPIDSSLAQLAAQGGLWQLSVENVLTTPTAPTVPSLVVKAMGTPGARTFDGYANVMYGTFLDSGSSNVQRFDVNVSSPTFAAESALYGRVETAADLTGLGPMTSAQANAILAAILAPMSGAPLYTAPITVGVGQLFTTGGGPVSPKVVPLLLPALVSVQLQDPDTAFTGTTAQFLVGEAAVDVDSNTVQLTPAAAARTDFAGYLARLAKK